MPMVSSCKTPTVLDSTLMYFGFSTRNNAVLCREKPRYTSLFIFEIIVSSKEGSVKICQTNKAVRNKTNITEHEIWNSCFSEKHRDENNPKKNKKTKNIEHLTMTRKENVKQARLKCSITFCRPNQEDKKNK